MCLIVFKIMSQCKYYYCLTYFYIFAAQNKHLHALQEACDYFGLLASQSVIKMLCR